ncbi:MAG: Holliday junction branch migration protein RuvA, partial [Defluviitaleaceae bacterium]|nr:Holliday junction branch migration protein RuvA [Defluviitaleaceae bacterium]
MIAHIKGTVEHVAELSAVIEVNGVGYRTLMSATTAARLPARGTEVKIYTYMQVREDGVSLYGFLTPEEVSMFTLLISVSGIGPKAASSMLSVLTPQQTMLAIVADDAAALSKAPGVGKKTAQRIILE